MEWTLEEDAILKEKYPAAPGKSRKEKCMNIEEYFPGRSWEAVESRTRRLELESEIIQEDYSGTVWTPEQEEELLDKLSEKEGIVADRCREIAEEGFYGRSFYAIKGKANKLGYTDDESSRYFINEINTLRKQKADLENFRAMIDDAIMKAFLKRPPRLTLKRTTPKNTDGKFIANPLIGDIQCSERFEKGDVMGLWEYNSKIVPLKVNRWIERFNLIQDALDTAYYPSRIVLDLLGDLIEGIDIYPGQNRYIDQEPMDAIFIVADEIAKIIMAISNRYPNLPIDIMCVYGNHGRTSKNHHKRNNYDYAVCRILQRIFAHVEGINIYISLGENLVYEFPEFPGKRNLIFHGDTIPSTRGFPYYGLDRAMGQISEIMGLPVSYTKCGHFHREAEGSKSGYGKWIINGSFVGASPYSISQMRAGSGASQTLLTFHNGLIINRADIFLDDEIKFSPDENGIYTPVLQGCVDY